MLRIIDVRNIATNEACAAFVMIENDPQQDGHQKHRSRNFQRNNNNIERSIFQPFRTLISIDKPIMHACLKSSCDISIEQILKFTQLYNHSLTSPLPSEAEIHVLLGKDGATVSIEYQHKAKTIKSTYLVSYIFMHPFKFNGNHKDIC